MQGQFDIIVIGSGLGGLECGAMLAREGLGGKGYLDIKDFMKQYEQQQSAAEAAPAPASDTSSEQTMKGSTSHG
ncbi:MAG: hypothetical protein EGR20_13670 [Alistipes onderdonkii]|nr:hypothetical protein [Alistipes onderdonkii]